MKNFKKVKEILRKVQRKVANEPETSSNKKLLAYIRDKISKLSKDIKKKITIGVFGKTGDGKSSLINAILGEKFLLPSGSGSACTSVIIQVEANVKDSEYTAEIEFISEEEWKLEFKSLLSLSEPGGETDKDELHAAKEKIRSLYGADSMNSEELKEKENSFKIGELAYDLFKTIRPYVRHNASSAGACYWPIVKIVTIKVPHCKDFLEHIVLLDLPGTGDLNKSRDEMWKMVITELPLFPIVSDINRADSDKLAWDIVSTSIRDLAQGGECSSMSFICTKTDQIDPEEYINDKSKKRVRKNFDLQATIKQHFTGDDGFFSVFTVSSKEFTNENSILEKEQTVLKGLIISFLYSFFNQMNRDGHGFHQTLTSLCKNDGFCRSKDRPLDLNKCLATHMYDQIDYKFIDIFPVQEEVTEMSLSKNIDKFTIISNDLNDISANVHEELEELRSMDEVNEI
ncbi:nuclear GTPase SLIP-GC-like [Electrophorus electricus]|uniref:nuclear GTPase SLIP-GC-like n=1 Tax=Electrophorus electricus TaxID=8005 RepID=UPI0015D0CB7F|nr:nuclear GTPase SLIP-GC-like [Electrophorus electricus]